MSNRDTSLPPEQSIVQMRCDVQRAEVLVGHVLQGSLPACENVFADEDESSFAVVGAHELLA